MEFINHKKYHSNDGMSTKHFGPMLWNYLFISILGRYPVKLDKHNDEHIQIAKSYYMTLVSIKDTLPCIYCRKSYSQFLKELPIKPFLKGRIELFYWVYLIKDKVNKKLINQENELYNNMKYKLHSLYENKKINKQMYDKKLKTLKKKIFVTIPTPPFTEVLDKYEKYRAKCKNKKCSLSKNKS
jgi:hypothetical protein